VWIMYYVRFIAKFLYTSELIEDTNDLKLNTEQIGIIRQLGFSFVQSSRHSFKEMSKHIQNQQFVQHK